jgi:hypothetical protein
MDILFKPFENEFDDKSMASTQRDEHLKVFVPFF